MEFEEQLLKGKFSGEVVDGKDYEGNPIPVASGRGTFIVDSEFNHGSFRFTATGFNENNENCGAVAGCGRLVRADGTLKYIGGFCNGWFDGRGTEFEKNGVTPSDNGDGHWEYQTHGFINCYPVKPGAPAPRSIAEAGEPGHDVHVDDKDTTKDWNQMIDHS